MVFLAEGVSADDARSPSFIQHDGGSLAVCTPALPPLEHLGTAVEEGLELEAPLDDPILFTVIEAAGEDDDGLHQPESDTYSFAEEGSFGNDEEVDIGADAYVWKIDHHKSHHRLGGML